MSAEWSIDWMLRSRSIVSHSAALDYISSFPCLYSSDWNK